MVFSSEKNKLCSFFKEALVVSKKCNMYANNVYIVSLVAKHLTPFRNLYLNTFKAVKSAPNDLTTLIWSVLTENMNYFASADDRLKANKTKPCSPDLSLLDDCLCKSSPGK